MKTVPAMKTVSAVMQPTKAVPTTIRMMKAVPAAMRITKTVPAKLLRPGRTIIRPNSYYAVLCCKTERVPSGTLFAFKVCFVRVIVRRLKTVLLVEERPQFFAPARVFELAQRFGLNLADTLAGYVKLLSDLFQRMVGVHTDTETHTQDAFFTRGQR